LVHEVEQRSRGAGGQPAAEPPFGESAGRAGDQDEALRFHRAIGGGTAQVGEA
jgi:hypothetical protein